MFTTHTPVAAGHDAFPDQLFAEHFTAMAAAMGVGLESLLALGRAPGVGGRFNMTRLALHCARRINGVSRIHGIVSSQLCADHWPEIPAEENPVGYVTNGVHVPTFLSSAWASFLDQQLPDWRERLSDVDFWQAIEEMPDALFWAASQDVKSRMLTGVRARLTREFKRKRLGTVRLGHITKLLDPFNPNVLTIGFARRFATYKRAALILRDRDRLLKLVKNEERPVVFCSPQGASGRQAGPGSAARDQAHHAVAGIRRPRGVPRGLRHPARALDGHGRRRVAQQPDRTARSQRYFRHQGCGQRRPNLSILDGWWAEAFDGINGWGIPGADSSDEGRRDWLDAGSVLDAIEEEVVPFYYDRQANGVSQEWVRRCKRAMASVVPRFNMRRTVSDYAAGLYQPAAAHAAKLLENSAAGASGLAAWKKRVREQWGNVKIVSTSDAVRGTDAGSPLLLRTVVEVGQLAPEDLRVEFKARRLLPESQFDPRAAVFIRPWHAGWPVARRVRAGRQGDSAGRGGV